MGKLSFYCFCMGKLNFYNVQVTKSCFENLCIHPLLASTGCNLRFFIFIKNLTIILTFYYCKKV